MWCIVRHINETHTANGEMRVSITSLPFPSPPLPFLPFREGRERREGGRGGAGLSGSSHGLRFLFFDQVDGVVSVGQRADHVVEDEAFVVIGQQTHLRQSFREHSLVFGSVSLHRGLRRDFVEQRGAVGVLQHPRRGSPRDAFRLLFLMAVGFQDGVHLGPQADELGYGTTIVLVLHLAQDLLVANADGRVRRRIVAGVVIVEVRGHVCVHIPRLQVVDQAVGVGHEQRHLLSVPAENKRKSKI